MQRHARARAGRAGPRARARGPRAAAAPRPRRDAPCARAGRGAAVVAGGWGEGNRAAANIAAGKCVLVSIDDTTRALVGPRQLWMLALARPWGEPSRASRRPLRAARGQLAGRGRGRTRRELGASWTGDPGRCCWNTMRARKAAARQRAAAVGRKTSRVPPRRHQLVRRTCRHGAARRGAWATCRSPSRWTRQGVAAGVFSPGECR